MLQPTNYTDTKKIERSEQYLEEFLYVFPFLFHNKMLAFTYAQIHIYIYVLQEFIEDLVKREMRF